jgi:hypothetical protein
MVLVVAFAVVAVVVLRPDAEAPAQPADTGTPLLQVDRDSVDLGDVPLGEWVEVSFTLTNTGDGPVRMQRTPWFEVRDGCCPPGPVLGADVLQPGEQASLSIRFVMAGNMGGPHDFRIHLPNNDPAWDERTLAVLSNWVDP